MMNTIRIPTNIGKDNFLHIQLTQNYDFLEVLSLKIQTKDFYKIYNSNYGVLVGRVIANGGIGVPNAKVSIFIPIDDIDANDIVKLHLYPLYPYKNVFDKNSKNKRYNLLGKNNNKCNNDVGSFFNKRDILDNDICLEIFDKYYKFTTKTNYAGDYMLMGIPVGTWKMVVDCDLSDIGYLSLKKDELISLGWKEVQNDNVDLEGLSYIYNEVLSVNILPFWGDENLSDVGITRHDVFLNKEINSYTYFIGSIFSDDEKNSINKNCRPRKDMGELCSLITGSGRIEGLRVTHLGYIERFDVEGFEIDDEGTWIAKIPLNLDYYITDEYGNIVPSDRYGIGIPIKGVFRFRVSFYDTGDEGRLRKRAKYIIPNNPINADYNTLLQLNNLSYQFEELLSKHISEIDNYELYFREMYRDVVYTVKNYIPRIQRWGDKYNRNFIGIKSIDDCKKNLQFPYNRVFIAYNKIFKFYLLSILCNITKLFAYIVFVINRIITGIRLMFEFFIRIMWSIDKLGCVISHPTNKDKRGACRCYKLNVRTNSELYEDNSNLIDDEGNEIPCVNHNNIPGHTQICYQSNGNAYSGTPARCAQYYYCKDVLENDNNCIVSPNSNQEYNNCRSECKKLPKIFVRKPGYIVLKCEIDENIYLYMPYINSNDNNNDIGCNLLNANTTQRYWCNNYNNFYQDINSDLSGTISGVHVKSYVTCQIGKLTTKFDLIEFEFYNDWINGSLYFPLFKVKKNKYCGGSNLKDIKIVDCCDDINDTYYNLSTLNYTGGKLIDFYGKNYYYASHLIGGSESLLLFATDIYCLGVLNLFNNYKLPKAIESIPPTTYNMPPYLNEYLDDNNLNDDEPNPNSQIETTGIYNGLLSKINNELCLCTIDIHNCRNAKKICEIGVGLDEYDDNQPNQPDGLIDDYSIENPNIRKILYYYNDVTEFNNIRDFILNNPNVQLTFGSGPLSSNNNNNLWYKKYRGYDRPSLFGTKNSFYFYFGLYHGKTAIDKFMKLFIYKCDEN